MQIRIFTIKEDNIYDKLIKDQMLAGNYSEAKSVVTQTLNKKYADDETYYLSGLITATESSQSEAIAEWENGAVNLHWPGNVNVREVFQKYVDCPVYVDNDANVAALGEKHKGAGEGADDVVAITLELVLVVVSYLMERLFTVIMDQALKSVI